MKKKVLIVSSYDEMCGNATYTTAIVRGLSEHYEVEVAPLKLYLTQSNEQNLVVAADKHIGEIASRAAEADFLNIQFERGLYGATAPKAAERVIKLIRAAKNVIVTFHRVDPPTFNMLDVAMRIVKLRFGEIPSMALDHATIIMYRRLVAELNRKARGSGSAWAMVHTERERRIFEEIYKLKNVSNYPLTYLFPEDRERYLATCTRDTFIRRYGLDQGKKYIGAFGFFGMYKGYDTLINALNYLPPEYEVLLFGSQHPQSIKSNERIEVSVQQIMSTIEKLPRRSRGRVRFMGSPDDDGFIEALHCVDAAALPYLEVGQGMSGVIALGHEVGANIVAANNLSFLEFQKIFGSVLYTFDIGNHIDLAQRLVQAVEIGRMPRKVPFDTFGLRQNAKLHANLFERNAPG